jgi:hypothetical protein
MEGLPERHPLLRNQTYLSHYSCLLSLSLSLSLPSKCRLSPVYAPQGQTFATGLFSTWYEQNLSQNCKYVSVHGQLIFAHIVL